MLGLIQYGEKARVQRRTVKGVGSRSKCCVDVWISHGDDCRRPATLNNTIDGMNEATSTSFDEFHPCLAVQSNVDWRPCFLLASSLTATRNLAPAEIFIDGGNDGEIIEFGDTPCINRASAHTYSPSFHQPTTFPPRDVTSYRMQSAAKNRQNLLPTGNSIVTVILPT